MKFQVYLLDFVWSKKIRKKEKNKQQANNQTGFDPGKWNRHEETAPIRACLDQDGK